jgi:hypothetical protein
VFGIPVAVWSTLRSKRSADAARDAALEVRTKLAHFDVVAECSAAIAILEELKRLHRTAAWHVLPDRYSSLKRSLIMIRTASLNLTDEHRTNLQNAIGHVASFENAVERVLSNSASPPSVPKLNRVVSRQVTVMAQLLVEIRNQIS